MSENPQISALTASILDQNPDLARIGRLLLLTPVHYLLRGVYVDRTAYKGVFRPKAFLLFLPRTLQCLDLSWSVSVDRPAIGDWDLSLPGVERAFTEAMGETHIPFLRTIDTLEKFAAFAMDPLRFPGYHCNLHPLEASYLEAARGNFAAAVAHSERLIRRPAPWHGEDERHLREPITQVLHPLLLAGDRVALGAQLRRLEYRNVKMLKLTKYWEPQPYPVELGAGG